MSKTDAMVQRLEEAGFAAGFIRGCLPDWWDEQAEASESAWLQMQLGLAQHLSIDPITLIDPSRPLQLSDVGRPRFKHLKLNEAQQRAANGFANGLARLLLAATPVSEHQMPTSAAVLRQMLLAHPDTPWVGFPQLLQLCYAFGIPVAHLTAFPAGIKGMAAMTTTVAQRPVIFTARRPNHSAQVAFYIAHELGHVVLGHVQDGSAIIEGLTLDTEEVDDGEPADDEEVAADEFAFELLTGDPKFLVSGPMTKGTAKELARTALDTGRIMRIDPGLIVLCFGKATGRWPVATEALKQLNDQPDPVPNLINRALRAQLDTDMLSFDDQAFVDAVAAT
jgi:hypothetical protein